MFTEGSLRPLEDAMREHGATPKRIARKGAQWTRLGWHDRNWPTSGANGILYVNGVPQSNKRSRAVMSEADKRRMESAARARKIARSWEGIPTVTVDREKVVDYRDR